MSGNNDNTVRHGPNGPAKAGPDDEGMARGNAPYPRRKSLRNANINYRNGWFFVTTQVAHNKCILGAIVADRCVLTPLGEAVRDYWLSMPAKHPEVELDEFVVMPNHFHAILRIHYRPTNKEHHLGYIMSRFKGGTGYIYGKMLDTGRAQPIEVSGRGASAPAKGGAGQRHLWQFDYWDDLVTSAEELENQRRYIRNNPANWTRDRYGPCTQYTFGNLDLLSAPRIAFVASQGFPAAALQPRLFGAKAPCSDMGGDSRLAPRLDIENAVLISTFTSAQEREALRRALAKGRRVIAVLPQGLPNWANGAEAPRPDIEAVGFSPQLIAACREGNALLLSPQPPGSRLNKKAATWCNEYVLSHASEIWIGDISEGGMLNALLKTISNA
jgi:REP element-mobilizing transposase RayT